MKAGHKHTIIGVSWIVFSVLVFIFGYLYFLTQNPGAISFMRCAPSTNQTILENLRDPLDCNNNLPFENLVK